MIQVVAMMTMGHACLYAYVQDHHKNLGISDCAHQSCICIIRSPLTALSLSTFVQILYVLLTATLL
jgi:hypothetical protein